MIEEVKQIFDDIRDAIIEMGGDVDVCTSPEEYAETIKTLSGNNAVLCVPVFKRSDVKPTRPSTPLNISNPGPDAYPDGWSTPDGLTGNVWMSYTIVSASTTYVPWTEPILIKTVDDVAPETYDDATTRTFLIFLELESLDYEPEAPTGGTWNTAENRLIGPITSSLKKNGAPTGRTTSEWSSDNNHIPGKYTWLSSGTFIAETGQIMRSTAGDTGWTTPFCINGVRNGKDGKDGVNGLDGEAIEFIYKLCENEDVAQSIIAEGPPESDPDVAPYEDDYLPGPHPNEKGYWCDHPMGIDPVEYRVEIMSIRKKQEKLENEENARWGDFYTPAIWSSWGEDGVDGDGIEYIFRVASPNEVIDNGDGTYSLKREYWPPVCQDDCAYSFLDVARNADGYVSDEDALQMYQQNEFVPGDLGEHYPDAASIGWDKNWTDDPLDVSPSQPFEFCAKRKYYGDLSNPDGTKGTWGWFSEPVLWNKFWSGYAPIFTSIVFTRSRLKLGGMTLTGGTALNPLPDPADITQTVDGTSVTEHIVWFDTVPGPDNYPNDKTMGHAPVWMTTRQFGSIDPDHEQQDQGWESPRLMADNRFFNTEYSASDVVTLSTDLPRFDETPIGSAIPQPFIDNNDPEGVNETAWRNWCRSQGLGIWGDENDIPNPKWMATCSFIDGKWTEWAITQIKGEDGEPGEDGIVYTLTPSVNSVIKDPNTDTYSPTTVTCTVTKRKGTEIVTADGTLKYKKDNGTITNYSNGVTTSGLTTSITFLYYVGNTEVAKIVVPLVTNGQRGVQGQKGNIGARMRMRNFLTTYTAPDSEGQTGWLSGDGTNDAYYDIAIWPVANEGVTITNAASNSDRLYRCTQSITYAQIAALVTQYGTANVHPGTGGHLDDYFTQAVGWDFVATKLLLTDKLGANEIEANTIVANKLSTIDNNNGYVLIDNGQFQSFDTNDNKRIWIHPGDLQLSVEEPDVTPILSTPTPATSTSGTYDSTTDSTNWPWFSFTVDSSEQVSNTKQLHIGSNGINDIAMYFTLMPTTYYTVPSDQTISFDLRPILFKYENDEWVPIATGYMPSWPSDVVYYTIPAGTELSTNIPYSPAQSFAIPIHTNANANITQPGQYKVDLYLWATIPSLIQNVATFTPTIQQINGSGFRFSTINKFFAESNVALCTEIADSGLQVVLNPNNYFRVTKATSQNKLEFEFRTYDGSSAFGGIKVTANGIYYRDTSVTTGPMPGWALWQATS